MTKADIAAFAMNTPATLLADPHMQAVGFFEEQEHPSEGPIRTISIPHEWSESTVGLRYPAPRLGEHTAELLRECGFSQDEADAVLRAGGARAAEGELTPAGN